METVLALLAIAAMLVLGAVAFALLMRMFATIRALRGVTSGLHDTMRWAVGQVSANPAGGSPGGPGAVSARSTE